MTSVPTHPSTLTIGILGPVEFRSNGTAEAVGGAKTRALLALLAVHAGDLVPVDRCLDELWPEKLPTNPRNALQARVSGLRRLIGTTTVEGSASGYRLAVNPARIDAQRLADHVAKARRLLAIGDLSATLAEITAAQRLIRGDPLLDAGDGDEVEAERRRLRELVGEVAELSIEARLASGDGDVIDELVALVARHPTRERLWAQLMLALYRAGRIDEALRAYQDARRCIGEIGIEPGPELRDLEHRILTHQVEVPESSEPTSAVTAAGPRSPRTSFVGREDEVESLTAEIAEHRLVTLLGTGGVGKTRLALEVAERTAQRWKDGVRFVDLAVLRAGADALPAIASGIGVLDGAAVERDALTDRLLAAVWQRQILVVVDNCEHVLDSLAPVVDALLDGGAGLHVLATSREHLGVPGERQVRVPSLPVPPAPASPSEIDGSPAVRLFAERAGAADPSFELDDSTRPAVARLVRRLDGMPLALELAAGRVASVPVAEIEARLDGRFTLLENGSRTAQPRQRTLHALIDWSHDLLFPDEQKVFRRLAVFAGPFTLSDAQALCADDQLASGDVAALTARLVEKSMVSRNMAMYRLLDTLRAYACEQLEAAGEDDEMRSRHASVIAAATSEAGAALRGDGQLEALARLDAQRADQRAALEWAWANEHHTACDLALACAPYWSLRDRTTDAIRHLTAASDATPTREPELLLWRAWFELERWNVDDARALAGTARSLAKCGDVLLGRAGAVEALASLSVTPRLIPTLQDHLACRRAESLLDEAEAMSHAAGDEWGEAFVRLGRAGARTACGDFAAGDDLASDALHAFTNCGDRWGMNKALLLRSLTRMNRGDPIAARLDTEAGLELARTLQHAESIGAQLQQLGAVHLVHEAPEAAVPVLEEAVDIGRRFGTGRSLAVPLNFCGIAHRRTGDAATAVQMHREALDLYQPTTLPLGKSVSQIHLAQALIATGEPDEATPLLSDGWADAAAKAAPKAQAAALEGVAMLRLTDAPSQVAILLGAANRLRRQPPRSPAVPLPDRSDLDDLLTRVRIAIGEDDLAQSLRRGASLDVGSRSLADVIGAAATAA